MCTSHVVPVVFEEVKVDFIDLCVHIPVGAGADVGGAVTQHPSDLEGAIDTCPCRLPYLTCLSDGALDAWAPGVGGRLKGRGQMQRETTRKQRHNMSTE
jgi:hypothetical protein